MEEKFKVLIADNLDAEGVEILEKSEIIEVDYHKKIDRTELLENIHKYDGLIVRSASKINAEVVARAQNLKVVVRAGVGVDNIDIPACSQKGIVVMNAPAGNSVSTAEQAIALLFALARKTSQASASMKEKKWEKNKFKGSQVTGKTIGVIGLGRIGKEVVKRCKGLQMRVLGFDPYIPKDALQYLQIDIVDVDTILSQADFITVHTPLTDTTKGIVNSKNLNKLKKGVRLINCARGGIYDEAALAEGIKSGVIGGVGLDVFTSEPPSDDFPLYDLPGVVMTPHLGASTDEAQLEVAKETVSSIIEFLRSGVARNSLNFPTMDPEQMSVLKEWFKLSEKLGSFLAQSSKNPIRSVQIEYQGEITSLNLNPLEIAFAKGILSVALGNEVNLVNAPVFARERGISISSSCVKESQHEASAIRVVANDGKETLEVTATVNFSGGTIIGVNNLPMEFKPEGHILLIKNKDIPKVVGQLGNLLGDAGINIASLQLARDAKGGSALTFIGIDDQLPENFLDHLQEKDFILDSRYIKIL